jgi:hypothetical protein
MTRRFEHHPDELISASLTGDLTDVERGQLEVHLAGCERCRQTLDAFADQRRLLSGMRHVPAPRDLGARVSAGVATAGVEQPWFRRPSSVIAAFSGAVALAAGVLLAALLTGQPLEPQVGATDQATPTGGVAPTGPLPTATMTSAPSPEATPEPVLAMGDTGYLSMTGTNVDPQLSIQRVPADGQPETVTTLEPTNQPPVAAVLSPDGQWLAYQTFSWGKGTNHAWLVRLSDGQTLDLGETPGDAFGRQMAWFGASKELLAYTGLAEDQAGPTTDVWVSWTP